MFFRLISIIIVCLVTCRALPTKQENSATVVATAVATAVATDMPVDSTSIVTVNGTVVASSFMDRVRLFSDMVGIRNYACKKYFICRVGQFFAAKMSLKERLLRFLLEFPLASLSLLEDEEEIHKSEMAETLATAISGFTRNVCSDELYQLCRSHHGGRSNFTDTATGLFIRHLLLDQDVANKMDHELLAQAQQEISRGFWNLVNSYMIKKQ